MLGHLLLPEIQELLNSGQLAELRDAVKDFPPPILADLIGDLPDRDMALVFRVLPRSAAAGVFEYLPFETQEHLLKGLAQEQVAQILNDMAPDDRTALLEELPAEATRRLLTLLSPAELKVAKQLLGYPEESVGRRMTPDYIAIRENWTVSQVLEHVRARERESETLDVLYVVDDRGKLQDDIHIRRLLVVALDRRVRDLIDGKFIALNATDDQETAVTMFRTYDRSVLPVVDSQNVMVGIVTIDDVLDLAEQEATEDIHKLGGLEALELPYMATSFGTLIRKRAGWLAVLFLGEMFTATAMGFFEHEIEKAVVLAMFVPLIISSGGNSGSQAASLIIRSLALGELTIADWKKVLRREFLSGLTLGVMLGAIGFMRISIWSVFSDVYGPHWALLGLAIWLSLVGVVLWGAVAGAMMPLLMRRIGADPATSSAPFVATLVDVTGLVIYFSVAAVVLRGTLL